MSKWLQALAINATAAALALTFVLILLFIPATVAAAALAFVGGVELPIFQAWVFTSVSFGVTKILFDAVEWRLKKV